MGDRNRAVGAGSAAIGRENITGSGDGSGNGTAAIALGYSNFASGDYSAAIGEDNYTIGNSSIALGYRNRPAGNYGVAIGNSNAAGLNTVALGFTNGAGGEHAIALGRNNGVGGYGGVAIGANNTVPVSSTYAIAIGYLNIASGNYSTAMGHRMNTKSQAGAFIIGDTDPLGQGTTEAGAGATDQFVARFRNGYYLMTSGTVTRTGVFVGAGQNAWGSISDSTKKERLLPMNHADVLQKIGGMKLSSWNYKGQRDIRHYGPMAQDFYATFGHDELGQIGCDTLIYSHDFAGVTFAGVQALIRENEKLKAELSQTKAHFENRLALLERALLGRKRVTHRTRIYSK